MSALGGSFRGPLSAATTTVAHRHRARPGILNRTFAVLLRLRRKPRRALSLRPKEVAITPNRVPVDEVSSTTEGTSLRAVDSRQDRFREGVGPGELGPVSGGQVDVLDVPDKGEFRDVGVARADHLDEH